MPAAPGTGNIAEVVPTRTLVLSKPVGLQDSTVVGDGLTVALSDVRATTASARLPGEVGGAAVRVEVTFTNKSARDVDLGAMTVLLAGSDTTPAVLLQSASDAAPTTAAAGSTATGTYIFSNTPALVQPVTVSVLSSVGAPVARFVGPVK